jgi:predicted transcriptional regulator
MTPPGRPRDATDSKLLTPAELELMTVLWQLGEGTVREVMDHLEAEQPPAYTTVSTIVRILEQKGFVASRKRGRSHVYAPSLDRPAYERRNVRHLVGSLFDGDPAALARHLVDDDDLSDEDLQQLQALLERRLGR